MKIIAISHPFTFLAEISANEIDYLAGETIGKNEGGYYGEDRREIQIGTTFNITEAFSQIHRNNQRKREIEILRATLNAILVGLDMIEPLIKEPKPEEVSA